LKKGGVKLKIISFPLKLLSQSQPNFAEMIVGWSPSKNSSNLGTFWLKIEISSNGQNCSIFSNGGYLGYRTALTDTILKRDHLRIIQTNKQNKSFKNLLVRNHLANFNQTLSE
jgi:hypothetical protein